MRNTKKNSLYFQYIETVISEHTQAMLDNIKAFDSFRNVEKGDCHNELALSWDEQK